MAIPRVLLKVCFVAQKLRGHPSAFSEPLEANGTEEVPGREGPRDLTGFTPPLCSHQAAPPQPLVISCMAPLPTSPLQSVLLAKPQHSVYIIPSPPKILFPGPLPHLL